MAPHSFPDMTVSHRLIAQVKTLQFVWFIGHLSLILCVLRYAFLWTRMESDGRMAEFCYRTAFVSAVATYTIAVYKIWCFRIQTSQDIPIPGWRGALSLATGETAQYLALAIFWLLMPQQPMALLPYCIYSIFHVAVYVRSDLIPILKTTTFQTDMMSRLQAEVSSRMQTEIDDMVTPFKAKLQDNFAPLQTKLQDNLTQFQTKLPNVLNLEIQAKIKTMPVDLATTTVPDATMLPTSGSISDSIANKIGVFITKYYDMSMSVLAQTVLSFFVPQWINPIFHLVTRLTAPPIDALDAKTHTELTPDLIAHNIGVFIKAYYDVSMLVVTRIEVLIWFSLLFSAVTVQSWSWIMIALYTVFIRARYDVKDFARLEADVDGFLGAQNVPLTARSALKSIMGLTRQFYNVLGLNGYITQVLVSQKIKHL